MDFKELERLIEGLVREVGFFCKDYKKDSDNTFDEAEGGWTVGEAWGCQDWEGDWDDDDLPHRCKNCDSYKKMVKERGEKS